METFFELKGCMGNRGVGEAFSTAFHLLLLSNNNKNETFIYKPYEKSSNNSLLTHNDSTKGFFE